MQTRELNIPGYEKVVEGTLEGGVKSIIAVHNTRLGPALGGLRFYPYHSDEEALTDVLRLSEGMTYKSALASLPLGGGKAVIIGDPAKLKTRRLLESFGEFINTLNGSYITAKDVGIEVEDLDIIATKSRFIQGTSAKTSGGDPSPVTAYGVYKGLQAAAKFRWGNASLRGRKIVIQGLGHVGYGVAKLLSEEGAVISATELKQNVLTKAQKELHITPLGPDTWQDTTAEIVCPCAMGATINKQTIPNLIQNKVEIIAGGANNQLLNIRKDGERLRQANILYAPDFVINAGGIINIACELDGHYNPAAAMKKTEHIYDILLEIFARAEREKRPTSIIATEIAREKVGLKN